MHSKDILKNIQSRVKKSEKEITILFTDIVASSSFWESAGNVQGRMMIDRHNRLILPIIRQYNGRLIKTIGDSLMVSFKQPARALSAAAAIQQALKEERNQNSKFPCVRIGIHSGRAIVEKEDVWGDTINVAKRIEERARANEILLSTRTARKITQSPWPLEKHKRFIPKGKKQALTVYKCRWDKAGQDFLPARSGTFRLMPVRQQRGIIFCALASAGLLIFLFMRFIRYILADIELIALLGLNPAGIVRQTPWLAVLLTALIAGAASFILKMKRLPLFVYRTLHGGAGFFIFYLAFLFSVTVFSLPLPLNSDKTIYQSRHIFVEITAPLADIHIEPSLDSAVLGTLRRGMLLLQADINESGGLVWNRVLTGKSAWGWVLRKMPPKIGIPERRISFSRRFEFSLSDVYALVFGLIGFFIAFIRFKIRPA